MRQRARLKYSPVSIFLHWLIAFAVMIMLCVGFLLDEIPEPYQPLAYLLHKSTGISILFLMFIRLIWIHAVGKPPLPDSVNRWEKILSRFVQYGFYLLLILMPLSGWVMSVAANRVPSYFGLFSMPLPGIGVNKPLSQLMGECHETIAWILMVFIVLHVAGALKHHFIDKDEVLKRMLPGHKISD